ncbi:sugar ABC transporter permease [Virgibacillus sp. 179-BFC.A HS]|uniref:Sugar ABC transporter permease n=1 Tax=Tigheibacillus jepli TaxID=3035914 RepID=A0ABU5CJ96_9BACI|nr:sugar ABC transporter permease [Virgibacillus sp. 179-BFC.A HS]MDY0406380.1 sugar ABC transporter permease [Virgibacillus sp. 179-BFC.A HS]
MEITNSNEAAAKRLRKKEWKLFGTGMLYLLPAIVFMAVFLFYPIVKTLYFSFFDVTGGGVTERFVGLKNYAKLLSSQEFLQSMKATFLFVLYVVPGEIIISLFLAVIASEKLKGMGFFRTIFSSTLGVSVAAGATVFLFMFHPSLGAINNVLGMVGIGPIEWLTSSNAALISIAITTIWMHIGINFIICLAGYKTSRKKCMRVLKLMGRVIIQGCSRSRFRFCHRFCFLY